MQGIKFDILGKNKSGMAFDSVKRGLKGVKKETGSLKKSFSGMKGLIATAFGGATIKAIADYVDLIQKTSIRLGVSTEALSEYKHVAELSGVSFEGLTNSMKKNAKSISDANQGLATQKRALADLNLSSEVLISLPVDKQFEIVADRIRGVKNQADKLRISQDLMGRSGSELITVFDAGGDSIANMRKEAKELSLTISQDQADAVAELNDDWTRFSSSLMAIGKDILAHLAPALSAIIELATDMVKVLRIGGETITSGFAYLSIKAQEFLGVISDDTARLAIQDLKGELANVWSGNDAIKKQKEFNEALKQTGDILGSGSGLGKTGGKGKKSGKSKKDSQDPIKSFETKILDAQSRITDSWLDSLFDTEKGFQGFGDSVKDIFKDLGKSFLSDVIGTMTKGGSSSSGGGLLDGLGSIFSSFSGGGMGGSSAGGGLGSLFSSFAGFFANGGGLKAGQWGIAGENGPEPIFAGNAGLSVVPNDKVSTSSGSYNQINFNISTPDANSFRKSSGQLYSDANRALNKAKRDM